MCVLGEYVHVFVCGSEMLIRREGLRILCSVEGNSFGEEPSSSSDEHFLYKLGKG